MTFDPQTFADILRKEAAAALEAGRHHPGIVFSTIAQSVERATRHGFADEQCCEAPPEPVAPLPAFAALSSNKQLNVLLTDGSLYQVDRWRTVEDFERLAQACAAYADQLRQTAL